MLSVYCLFTFEQATSFRETSADAVRTADEDNNVQMTNLWRVVLWMTGVLLSFSAMAISIRVLAGKLNIFEILSIRSGVGLLIMLVLLAGRADLRPLVWPNSHAT